MDITIINRGFTLLKSRIRRAELRAIKKNKLDISDLQWNYLVWVVERKDMKMVDLAKMLGVEKGTLSNNIKYLESKKLITKTNIGRTIHIEPTEKGKKYIEIHHKIHAEIRARLEENLGKEGVQTLLNIGNKVIGDYRNLDKKTA